MRLAHEMRHLRFVVSGVAQPLMRDASAAEPDRQPVAVGFFAGLADGHHDTAPIGVLARDGGFHQG